MTDTDLETRRDMQADIEARIDALASRIKANGHAQFKGLLEDINARIEAADSRHERRCFGRLRKKAEHRLRMIDYVVDREVRKAVEANRYLPPETMESEVERAMKDIFG